MKGRNDHEINDLVSFAIDRQLDISFIEEMPWAPSANTAAPSRFSPAPRCAKNRRALHLIDSAESTQGPSRYWRLAEAPHIRLGSFRPTATTLWHLQPGAADRRRSPAAVPGQRARGGPQAVLRSHPGQPERLEQAIIEAMKLKPTGTISK
jgi:cyclic pyranopterin phosphate synthase